MSNFCTKCGAAVSPDSTFCPACGNTIAAAAPAAAAPVATFAPAPPAAPPVYVAATPPPVYAAAPAPSSGGSSAVKIILIVVGVIVFIGVIGLSIVGYGAYRIAHAVHENVHVDSKTGNVDIATPGGTFSTNSGSTLSASDLGTDIYPGAVKGEGSMNLKTPQGSMVTAIYTTSDSAAQVVDFYKSKLGDQVSTVETGNGTMLTNVSDNTNQNSKLVITVTPENGSTKIAIVHTTKK